LSDKIDNTEETWNYTPLSELIPITEQVWPEGTVPLVCTRTMTYNHENYIRECIEGILMQKTTFPVRVCIHDDASTDKTASIVREYQEKYPNLIWAYYQEENSYRSEQKFAMREEFMKWNMVGKYQALCEGDDYWIDTLKLQKQVNYLENNIDHVLCATNAKVMDAETKTIIHEVKREYSDNLGVKFAVLSGGELITASIVFMNNLFKDEESLALKFRGVPGDYAVVINLSLKGKIAILPDITCVYRTNNKDSAMGKSKASSLQQIDLYYTNISDMLQWLDLKTDYIFYKIIREKISRFYYNIYFDKKNELNLRERLEYLISRHKKMRLIELLKILIYSLK
jgi:glycosyltransferase involved in cell wall biosynthesis